MQITRFSKILQTDFTGLQDRLPGNHILQSHGNFVSRGDLITQENMSTVPLPWTVTINKDTFNSLCTVDQSNGSFTTDQDGIYCNNVVSSGTSWHGGPVFYMQLPSTIGMSGQYWHARFRFTAQSFGGSMIDITTTVGYSTLFSFRDGAPDSGDGYATGASLRYGDSGSKSLYSIRPYTDQNIDYTYSFYHYANNTIKLYLNGTLVYNGTDPVVLDKGNNMISVSVSQWSSVALQPHRIKEITVSVNPSYDPQP